MPADSLSGRDIWVDFGALRIRIGAEVYGLRKQGKTRLHKHDPTNPSKLHLLSLVMAVACLPDPRSKDTGRAPDFPLESKEFLIEEMNFRVVSDTTDAIVLAPLTVSVQHSDCVFDLQRLLAAVDRDWHRLDRIRRDYPELADALNDHAEAVQQGVNSTRIRIAADEVIRLKSARFGPTNAGSAHVLLDAEAMPEVAEEDDIAGREGALLVRIHIYKERDRRFSRRVREHHQRQGDGRLTCEACGTTPSDAYGAAGDRAMEAHHKVPIEELQPDSEVRLDDMAMLCANCHRVVHSRKPCLTVDEVRELRRRTRRGGAPAA